MNRNDVVSAISRIRSNPKLSIFISSMAILASFLVRHNTPITLSYVPFYPAILLATVIAGPLLGIAATIVSAALAVVFFHDPGSVALTTGDIWSLGAFLIVSLLIIGTTDFLIKTIIQSNDQADRLQAADQHKQVLLRELSHRMKNQYAVILAMARATASSTTSIPEFQNTFSHRLHGLSRTHDLLVASDWISVSLEDLIAKEMEALSTPGSLTLQGQPLHLSPIAAANLGMALHELITNSVRFGAWTSDVGTVQISWKCIEKDFYFDWHERAGHSIAELGPKGFGRKILEHVVPTALEGASELILQGDGLHWYLRAPVKLVISPNGD